MKQIYETARNGHTWKLTENGEIDNMAYDVEGHNGPQCSECGYFFCEHCNPIPSEPCTAPKRIILI